ncbi:thermonuclease family protein [Desulfosediminicola ganghwensis]|uniref:thermonuclease family protein n=1 Tax=Desulfosediminicola ganghwensis TaxID=2569540 RepID=UPI003B834103
MNVNESLISCGYDWQYRKYCKASFCDDWLELDEQAKSLKIGLWRDSNPIPPWQWRKEVLSNSYNK